MYSWHALYNWAASMYLVFVSIHRPSFCVYLSCKPVSVWGSTFTWRLSLDRGMQVSSWSTIVQTIVASSYSRQFHPVSSWSWSWTTYSAAYFRRSLSCPVSDYSSSRSTVPLSGRAKISIPGRWDRVVQNLQMYKGGPFWRLVMVKSRLTIASCLSQRSHKVTSRICT